MRHWCHLRLGRPVLAGWRQSGTATMSHRAVGLSPALVAVLGRRGRAAEEYAGARGVIARKPAA